MIRAPSPSRWTAARKARLLRAHLTGLITAQEVEQAHGIGADELGSLLCRYEAHGEAGLSVTRLQEPRA